MLYVAQDLNDRMWLVTDEDLDRFLDVAGKACNQDALDDLAMSPEEGIALLEFLDGDNVWQLDSADKDFPIAFRPIDESAADALMILPINPAEFSQLR